MKEHETKLVMGLREAIRNHLITLSHRDLLDLFVATCQVESNLQVVSGDSSATFVENVIRGERDERMADGEFELEFRQFQVDALAEMNQGIEEGDDDARTLQRRDKLEAMVIDSGIKDLCDRSGPG